MVNYVKNQLNIDVLEYRDTRSFHGATLSADTGRKIMSETNFKNFLDAVFDNYYVMKKPDLAWRKNAVKHWEALTGRKAEVIGGES